MEAVTKRILVVDDEPNMRATLADILGDEGYLIDSAMDGLSAVKMCEEQTYDVVLLDVRMPGIDGVETFRRITRRDNSVRVVLMSAYTMDDLKRTVLEEGAVAFLSKPLDIDNVVGLIQGVRDTSILVVENDVDTASQMQDSFKKQGYWVKVTSSPHDALELAEQIHFDIVIIDVQLPAMSGLDLCLAIKKIIPRTVAIMVSSREQEQESMAKEAVRQTAYTVIHKPLDMGKLDVLLTRISGQRISNALNRPVLEAERV
ncbi:MAG: response regulator [Ectothiorhodospiraceae bacterium]|nr:response regulator [Ectothiorhodospiraceae bacterium]